MTERQLQEAIVECAGLFNWLCYHTWLSMNSAAGFPDLILARAGRLLVIECKSATGKLTAAQETWLGVLGGIPSCEVHVCRPVDWLNGDVERWLR